MSSVLAIDIGTSSVKALVVDQLGQEICSHQINYQTYYPKPDYAEQNPDEIYYAVKKIIHSCPQEVKDELSAISFSSAMHSVMAVNNLNDPITPLILWSDLRSKKEANMLKKEKQGIETAVKTGTPVHPMSPLCKLHWMKSNQPDIFKGAKKFIGIKEYIWFKFFECFEVDHGIASATGLFDIERLAWYQPALKMLGIDERMLSLPVSVYHDRTLDNPSLLSELGFSKPLPCIIGSSDGCLANLGSDAMDVEKLSLTIGTSGAVRRATMKNMPDPQGILFRYLLDEETLIEGGATNNGALLLEWFSKNFLKEEIDAQTFITRACRISAGAEGLIFVPYVFGERAPVYDPDASGLFYGIRQHHTIDHFMRAIIEGIGYALYSIAERMETKSGKFTAIMASGGFVKSENWVQIIANIFGRPVYVNQNENASALGAAIQAFKALGIEHKFSSTPIKIFQSDPEMHKVYKSGYDNYKKLILLEKGLK